LLCFTPLFTDCAHAPSFFHCLYAGTLYLSCRRTYRLRRTLLPACAAALPLPSWIHTGFVLSPLRAIALLAPLSLLLLRCTPHFCVGSICLPRLAPFAAFFHYGSSAPSAAPLRFRAAPGSAYTHRDAAYSHLPPAGLVVANLRALRYRRAASTVHMGCAHRSAYLPSYYYATYGALPVTCDVCYTALPAHTTPAIRTSLPFLACYRATQRGYYRFVTCTCCVLPTCLSSHLSLLPAPPTVALLRHHTLPPVAISTRTAALMPPRTGYLPALPAPPCYIPSGAAHRRRTHARYAPLCCTQRGSTRFYAPLHASGILHTHGILHFYALCLYAETLFTPLRLPRRCCFLHYCTPHRARLARLCLALWVHLLFCSPAVTTHRRLRYSPPSCTPCTTTLTAGIRLSSMLVSTCLPRCGRFSVPTPLPATTCAPACTHTCYVCLRNLLPPCRLHYAWVFTHLPSRALPTTHAHTSAHVLCLPRLQNTLRCCICHDSTYLHFRFIWYRIISPFLPAAFYRVLLALPQVWLVCW